MLFPTGVMKKQRLIRSVRPVNPLLQKCYINILHLPNWHTCVIVDFLNLLMRSCQLVVFACSPAYQRRTKKFPYIYQRIGKFNFCKHIWRARVIEHSLAALVCSPCGLIPGGTDSKWSSGSWSAASQERRRCCLAVPWPRTSQVRGGHIYGTDYLRRVEVRWYMVDPAQVRRWRSKEHRRKCRWHGTVRTD